MDSARRRKRSVRRIVLLTVGLLAAAGLVARSLIPKAIPVETAAIARGPLRVTIDEDGRTRVKDRFVIAAPVAGKLARVTLRAGDRVEAGMVVARLVATDAPLLDPRSRAQAVARLAAAAAAQAQAEASVERARVASAQAASELTRSKALAEKSAIAAQALERADADAASRKKELASAEFAARVAAFEREQARAALGRGAGASTEAWELRAPVAGQVLKIHHEDEGPVAPGTPIVEIADVSALEIVVDVLTSDAVRIPPRARATIDQWGGDRPLEARVRLVEPAAFTKVSALGVEEQRVNVILDLDGPAATTAALRDGFRVEAHIVVWEAPSVVKAPLTALFRQGEGWATYVARDGRARLVALEVGHRGEREVEVQRGVTEGERVLVRPGDAIRENVRISESQPQPKPRS